MARIFVILFLLLFTSSAFADEPEAKVVQGVNLVPKVCGPLYTALLDCPEFLTYDPVAEEKKTRAEKYGEDTCLPAFPKLETSPRWMWTGPPKDLRYAMPWDNFREENPKKFDALMADGERYGYTYLAVKQPGIALYNDPLRMSDIYFLFPLSEASKIKMPEVFLRDDGSDLAAAFNGIGANVFIRFGARGYPVVRKPGSINVYEIDADATGSNPAQPAFSSRLVCDFKAPQYTITFTSKPQPVPGGEAVYRDGAATPANERQ